MGYCRPGRRPPVNVALAVAAALVMLAAALAAR